MTPLLERIVGHLERVQRVADKQVVDRAIPLEFDRFEAFVLDLFEKAADGDEKAAARLDRDHWVWKAPYLQAFVEELHWGLLDGIAARWPAEERFGLIDSGLATASRLGDLVEQPSTSRARILDSVLDTMQQAVVTWSDYDRSPWQFAPWYCERLGLTRTREGDTRISPAGSALLQLRGPNRLRWLLALETSLATSSWDTWYADLGSIGHIIANQGWTIAPDPEGQPLSDSTLERWSAFGALKRWDDPQYDVHGFELTSIGQEILGELDRDPKTSFRTMVRAMLDDEREFVLNPQTGTDSPDRATAATIRHARMVAHEVRNALLPVQYALKKIWKHPAVATDLSESRRRVDEGLKRLYRFVDDSLRLTPATSEEKTSFSIMEVIDEARRECTPAPQGGITIETRPASAAPHCHGHRGRLVLAVLNLLRNAVQVAGPQVRIQISVDAQDAHKVLIYVQDDGPGIPEEQQQRLFENGVSHRDGGSGHGLSFVRLVVEKEMGGRVRLIPTSDETGACFELELPTEESNS